jgi:DNA polymerase-3 subunit epsilon
MSRFFVFDCETTGLPARRDIPIEDVDGWPRMVQLAWAIYDAWGRLEKAESHIIRPDGFRIPDDAARIHGISHDRALAEGRPVRDALDRFVRDLESPVDAVIAHNLDFDRSVVGAELIRAALPRRLFDWPGLCTMTSTTELLRLPGPYGPKWPKLDELHAYLFGAAYDGAHDAARDVEACARCFFELLRRGHYPRP